MQQSSHMGNLQNIRYHRILYDIILGDLVHLSSQRDGICRICQRDSSQSSHGLDKGAKSNADGVY